MSNDCTVPWIITPMDKLNDREEVAFDARKKKLKIARQNRAQHWANKAA